MPTPKFHTNSDGTVPCTNACGKNVKWSPIREWWVHEDGFAPCQVTPWQGQEACPESANPDPDFYDERGWARV